ncbi:hypothetical protein, partial [Salmonella sp. s54395]|uniref:hypothetical protein n=1 Tax=Salmonella sp. s54395 TaxID=3159664 RepID=UPI00397F0ADE
LDTICIAIIPSNLANNLGKKEKTKKIKLFGVFACPLIFTKTRGGIKNLRRARIVSLESSHSSPTKLFMEGVIVLYFVWLIC